MQKLQGQHIALQSKFLQQQQQAATVGDPTEAHLILPVIIEAF